MAEIFYSTSDDTGRWMLLSMDDNYTTPEYITVSDNDTRHTMIRRGTIHEIFDLIVRSLRYEGITAPQTRIGETINISQSCVSKILSGKKHHLMERHYPPLAREINRIIS